jgi:transposase
MTTPGEGQQAADPTDGRRQASCRCSWGRWWFGWFTCSFAGLDVTVYSSDNKRSPGHLSRQGSPQLRWAAFEAAKCAARRGSPDYPCYHKLAAKHDGHNGKNPTLAVERKLLRRCNHTLRELADAALAMPVPVLAPQEVAA